MSKMKVKKSKAAEKTLDDTGAKMISLYLWHVLLLLSENQNCI